MHDSAFQHLPLSVVAQRCEEETANFNQRRSYDPRYCFELFRRALAERIGEAWTYLYSIYEKQVGRWVVRHLAFRSTGEQVEDFVNRAFTKMWTSFTAEKFSGFKELDRLLGYLKMCVGSTIVDHVRAQKPPDWDLDQTEGKSDPDQPVPEWIVLTDEERRELWDWVESHLHDGKERKVIYGSFVLGLKPKEIYEHYRGVFESVAEIHRIKQNVLARLRRDDGLAKLRESDD